MSDATGAIVLGACAVWALIVAGARGGRPEGLLLAVLAVGAGYASGRISGALLPVAAPFVGALAGVGLAAAAPHTTPVPEFGWPLGQTGATAALLAISAGAACCAAWSANAPALRFALRLLAAGIAAAALLLGSTAGFAACTVILLCSLAAARMHRRGLGLTGLALATAVVTGVPWALAANVLPDGLSDSLEAQLGPEQVPLWQDALRLVRDDPALGVGPGRFEELSPTVAQSLFPDTDGKPHSAPLQQAAEQGVVGVVLLAAVFCWLLYTLWRTPRPTPVALSAGAALAALAAIASVGNALSFTAVTAGAGLLAGIATSRPLAVEGTQGAAAAEGSLPEGPVPKGPAP